MWEEVVAGIAGLAVAVVSQAALFGPESRRVRRLKAYLEVREEVNDAHLSAALTQLIAAEVADEERARARTKRGIFLSLRIAGWAFLALIFAGAAAVAWYLGGLWVPIIVSLLSLAAAGIAVFNTGTATEQAVAVRVENAESEAAAAYARDAAGRGLNVVFGGDGPQQSMFDAIARNDSGTVVEIAEFRRSITAQSIRVIINLAARAKEAQPEAKFVIVLSENRTPRLAEQLREIGFTVAVLLDNGSLGWLR
ncbi:hypothetical protein [Cellulosimicrobium sp. NPDC057862]|uniref:hypothetical protein n=1 Tax=Actinomycetes TaxID=1760 RepID=UPI00366A6359